VSERLLLEWIGGDRPPAELPRSGTLVIGASSARAGFVVRGQGVADLHAAIARNKSGGWAIRDLGSPAGLEVNGQRVESRALGAGDEIGIGAVRLRIVDPAATPPASQPTTAAPTAPIAAPTGPVSPVSPAPTAALPAFPGYRLERRLGRGGMGEVYLAIQERLARPVAIKVLHPRLGNDAAFVRRFEEEARAAAALNHPNVVTVYDVGFADGLHFLSMEYMDRGTLEDRLKASGRLPWKDVLQILKDAGAGLAYAESKGIVHRDLKPANLMQNAAGATKIADLGLATNIEAESEALSGERKILGTAHFMSPEQARGEKLDPRSDLYSLGATAYRLLSGMTPYEGATSKDILRALLREEPKPLSERVEGLPPALLAIVQGLMRRDLAQRTASAAELLAAIAEFERGASAAQPMPKATVSTRPPWVLIFTALLFGGGAWFFWQWKEQTLERREEEQAAAQAAARDAARDSADTPAPPVDTPVTAVNADPALPAPAEPVAAPANDERDLEILESRARIALLEILQRQQSPQEQFAELTEMARKFNGTTAASEASAKAGELEQQLREAQAALSERHTAVMALVAKLREAAALEQSPPRPGRSLLAMRALGGQEAFADDPLFQAERARLEQELFARASEHAGGVLARTQADLEAGRQEAAATALNELLPLFDLPEFAAGAAPAGYDALLEQGRRARERLANLRAIAGQILEQRQREDARLMAGALYGPEGLEKELSVLDFQSAATRVSQLAEAASTLPVRQALVTLAAELNEASQALPLLAREYPAGWKRKGVDDPRDRSESLRNCLAADAEGLLLEAAQGATERVPWSAFANHTRELGRLFNERFARELKPEEARSVRALLQYAAVGEVLSLGVKMLDPSRKANFTEGNAKELLECFAPAQAWALRSAPSATLTREIEAAQLLSRVWQDATGNSIAAAVAGTERLLLDYRDTLLVRLLSDGSQLK
jgi:hypothetical protein